MSSSPKTPPVAVITGASQGLGRALAEALVDRGWSLVVDARRAERLDRAVGALGSRGAVVGIAGDVTDPDHRDAIVQAAATLGAVQLVVNNASTLGASPLPSIADLDASTWHRLFDVNVIAPLALVNALSQAPRRPRHDRPHHVGCSCRTVRRLGWVRRIEGGLRTCEPRARGRAT